MFFQKEKEYDIVVCATGRKVPLEGFERRSMEAQVGNVHALDRTLQNVTTGCPKKRTFKMPLEPQCTGSIRSSQHPMCLEINFSVVSY